MLRIETLIQEALRDVNITDCRTKRLLLKLQRLHRSQNDHTEASRHVLDDLTQHAALLGGDRLTARIRDLQTAAVTISHASGKPEGRRRSVSADHEAPRPVKKSKTTCLADLQLLYEYLNPLPTAGAVPLVRDILADAALSNLDTTSLKSEDPNAVLLRSIWEVVGPLVPGRSARFTTKAGAIIAKLTSLTPDNELEAFEAVLDVMAQLCAPIRDDQVNILWNRIASIRESTANGNVENGRGFWKQALAEAYTLANNMQIDHSRYQKGALATFHTENALRSQVRQETMQRERDLEVGDNRLQAQSWMRTVVSDPTAFIDRGNLTYALLSALFDSKAVYAHDRMDQTVPVILHVTARRLLWTQNMLQAGIILAALATVVPARSDPGQTRWAERIWSLLTSVMRDVAPESLAGDRFTTANIADEIVHALHAPPTDHSRMQQRINALLRHEDPVFRLLRERLRSSALDHLTGNNPWISPKGFDIQPLSIQIPLILDQIRLAVNWAVEAWLLG